MLEALAHNELFLLALFVGLVIGAACGIAYGHDLGRARAFDEMRELTTPIVPADDPKPTIDPMQAIRDRIRQLEAAGPVGGPFGEL